MVRTPEWARPQINIVYPSYNFIEFERWFYNEYKGDETDREYLPIFWTAYYVNNRYGQDANAIYELQYYLDNYIDKTKKYYTLVQYDDGILNDVSGLDLLQFNMSKTGEFMYPLPLIGMPYPFKFNSEKKYLANFIGNITHPIREHAKTLQGKEGYYISFERHEPEEYCRIISESVFTLCYRGYGINSFRIAEALQYGSIPVYISDEFITPHNEFFGNYGIKIAESHIDHVEIGLPTYAPMIELLQNLGKEYYNELYTYEGTKDKILKHLLTLK